MKKFIFSLVCTAAALAGCTKPFDNSSWKGHNRSEFHSIESIMRLSPKVILTNMGKNAEPDSLGFDQKLKYDVNLYKYTYYTSYDNDKEIVLASGLLLVPEGVEETRFVGYCHGTVFPAEKFTQLFDIGSPSEYKGKNGNQDVRESCLAIASAGYCVAVPDYVGYGPTAGFDHPFIYYPELCKSAVDGFIAARDILKGRGLYTGKDIYLAGWSQGGGLALYMQRLLENDPAYKNEFNVKCTSCLSAPSDVYNFVMEMFKKPKEILPMIALYSWSCFSINRFCPGMGRPLDQIFRSRIYDQLDAIIMFGIAPEDLFTDFFIKKVLDGTDKTLLKAVEDCTTARGWIPKAPIFMHHGEEDSVVPCFNSVNAYNELKDVTESFVELHLYPKQDHTTFVPTFASKTIEEFNSCM